MTPTLRPFFSYFGSKWRMAKLYPEPEYKTIIEPFAGGAGYSLRYPDRNVVLCDKDPLICGLWRYLIRVKASEILALPDVDIVGTVDELTGIPQEAKWLIGFWLGPGAVEPRQKMTPWRRDEINRGWSNAWCARLRHALATQLKYIRHWRVIECSYQDYVPSRQPATWFVDPPYQVAGTRYMHGARHIDFEHLGAWCRKLPGQVMVCENFGATWLPFRPLASTVSTSVSGKRSLEVVWLSSERRLTLPGVDASL